MWNTHSTGRRTARALPTRRIELAGAKRRNGHARLTATHGVVAEGHAQLADGAVDVDAELVGEAQHLGAEVER